MPELPEVETIVNDLKNFLPGLKIIDLWTDIANFKKIKKSVVKEKILKVERRGKNILIGLTNNKTILVHQKMTGHLLYGKYQKSNLKSQKWIAVGPGPLRDDPENRFIHLLFFLSDGRQLALCDMRKFAKVAVLPTGKISEELKKLGPDPLNKNFSFQNFSGIMKNKKGKIKTILMNQEIISGIGNIYSDEILWLAGIHPLKPVQKLNNNEIKKIYLAIKPVLKKAIKARGSSYIDYRDASGKKGRYQEMHLAYQLTGTKCKKRDGGIIKKIKIGGRSAHFCPVHQKL
ncbi:MAG: DNA-formamidopyrimidine glycosylase [Candidatus Parcubacteria bacterium]|nr:DNA-formamidopyrimidine glycosylase [Candidatus Parcubacteria bacterium]